MRLSWISFSLHKLVVFTRLHPRSLSANRICSMILNYQTINGQNGESRTHYLPIPRGAVCCWQYVLWKWSEEWDSNPWWFLLPKQAVSPLTDLPKLECNIGNAPIIRDALQASGFSYSLVAQKWRDRWESHPLIFRWQRNDSTIHLLPRKLAVYTGLAPVTGKEDTHSTIDQKSLWQHRIFHILRSSRHAGSQLQSYCSNLVRIEGLAPSIAFRHSTVSR